MRINRAMPFGVLVGACMLLAACGGGGGGGGGGGDNSPPVSSSSSSSAITGSSTLKLKTLAMESQNQFPIGVAVGGQGEGDDLLNNTQLQSVVNANFNSLVAGNIMKMNYLEPTQNNFTYANADALVTYAQNHNMILHGHTLIWHSDYQVPAFMKNFSGTPQEWDAILGNHVVNIVAHFAGKVASWDVVNEALDETQSDGWRHSLFYTNSGNSAVYIENAFTNAHATDGAAKLYYNDYNIEWSATKLSFLLAMINDFKARNIPIDGIGFQMHVSLNFPDVSTIKASLKAVADTGLMVRISEFDVSVNGNGSLSALNSTIATQEKQRYHDIVQAFLQAVPVAQRGGITFWGVTDGASWLTGFEGHPEWPLLFNDDLTIKPAFDGVVQALQGM